MLHHSRSPIHTEEHIMPDADMLNFIPGITMDSSDERSVMEELHGNYMHDGLSDDTNIITDSSIAYDDYAGKDTLTFMSS